MFEATTSWLAALTVWPEPLGPTWTTVPPTVSNSGFASAKSASLPPTMIERVALRAPASPPDTGASSSRSVRYRACSSSATVTSGRMLEKSITRVPGAACSNTPPSPARTCRTSGESGTITQTTSAPVTASAIEEAARPPASVSGRVLSGVRLYPTTSWPARARWTAIGLPMMPRPRNAMVLMSRGLLRDSGSLAGGLRRGGAAVPATRSCRRWRRWACTPGRPSRSSRPPAGR